MFLAANTALASGSIGGRVMSSARPLAGVTVSAATAAMPKPFAVITAPNGAYAFPSVPPGTYDVTFALAGHQTLTRRTQVRGFERSRVDVELEVSEEGESVTQTAAARDVHERPQAVWTLDRALADALPLARGIEEFILLPTRIGFTHGEVDGVPAESGLVPPEGVAETAVLFAGAGAEHGYFGDTVIGMTTRGGGDFHGSLRDTISRWQGETTHMYEGSVGGRWMFAAGISYEDIRSGLAKATLAPTARDTATISVVGSAIDASSVRATWLHVSPRTTASVQAANDYYGFRGYHFAGGAHELAAGLERYFERDAVYVRDRWSASDRLVVEGGVRFERDELQPRAGVVFDPMGDGVTRLIASYANEQTAIGVARRLASTGYARAMLLHRDGETVGTLDGELHYLLFTFGTTATLGARDSSASAWVLVDPPLPGHDLTVALLGRYDSGDVRTDVAINYAWARDRVTPFAEFEVVNVFDLYRGRELRLGFGVRR